MRATSGQHRGEGGDQKYAWLYCTYEQYTSKIFQQGRGGKKAVPRCDAASRWGELRGCAPRDTGAKIPFDLPIRIRSSGTGLIGNMVMDTEESDYSKHHKSLARFAKPATSYSLAL